MSQIDVLLGGYTSEAAALADPALADFVIKGAWDLSRVFPGIQIWEPANDTTSTVTGPGGASISVPVHAYQPGFALIVSYADPLIEAGSADPTAASVAVWKAVASCLLIVDYDAWAANPVVGNTGWIYYAAGAIAAGLAGWRLQPTPARAVPYPFGNP